MVPGSKPAVNRQVEAAKYADLARSKIYGDDYIHNRSFNSRPVKTKTKNGVTKTKSYIASGRFGDVYKIEKDGQQPYVEKVVYGHPDFIEQEVEAQITASALGIAPKIREWVVGNPIPNSGGVAKHKILMDYVDPAEYVPVTRPAPGEVNVLGYDVTRDVVNLGLNGGVLIGDRHNGNMRRGPDETLMHLDFGVTKKLNNKSRIEGAIDTVAYVLAQNGQTQEAEILKGLKDEMFSRKDYKGAHDLAKQAANILQVYSAEKMNEIKQVFGTGTQSAVNSIRPPEVSSIPF